MSLRSCRRNGLFLFLFLSPRLTVEAANSPREPVRAFYLAADPNYTLMASMLDSVRFTFTKTLQCDPSGQLVSISSFVDVQGQVMGWA